MYHPPQNFYRPLRLSFMKPSADTAWTRFISSIRRGLMIIAGISLASNILMLALPIYSLQLFDRVLLSRSLDTFWVLTLGVVIAVAAIATLDWLRGQLLLRVSNRMALAFQSNLFDAILTRAARQGDRSLLPLRDLTTLRNFVSSAQGLPALIDAPLLPLFLLVVFLMHPLLGMVMLVGMLVLLAMTWVADKVSTAPSKVAFDEAQNAQRRLDDLVDGSDALSAHGMQGSALQYWLRAQHPALAHGSRAASLATHFASMAKGVRLMLNVCMTAMGGYLAMTDQITAGAMIAANILGSRGLAPLEVLLSASRQLLSARQAWERLRKLWDSPEAADVTHLPAARGEIEVERIVYAPPGAERSTIKGISFRLEAGTFLGVVGPSAAGKSTLGRLLCGVSEPLAGVIRLDGADLRIWHREDFGRSCGYLPQDVQLFEGTVRENICRFSHATDEAVIEAAQAAGAHDLIVRLNAGYETRIGAGGTVLSAGQRQRIGLARALFGNPQLVVLDEPNANLDTDGEDALGRSLVALKQRGATVVLISHRPAILSSADMVAVIVDGQLQQFGPRQEVMAKIQPPRIAVHRNVA